jgi:hypothetical protein
MYPVIYNMCLTPTESIEEHWNKQLRICQASYILIDSNNFCLRDMNVYTKSYGTS